MFTGIVEELGSVISLEGLRLRVGAHAVLEDARQGDSTAVNGCCLTIVDHDSDAGWWEADLSEETLRRTSLGSLSAGDPVNLERPVRLMDRLGGHLVQGHVDAVVQLLAITPQGEFSRWLVSLPPAQANEVARKGSVCLHGVSLTVAELQQDWFEVALIPATLSATTLHRCRPGARLHLETDVLAKYVARALEAPARSPLDEVFGSGASSA